MGFFCLVEGGERVKRRLLRAINASQKPRALYPLLRFAPLTKAQNAGGLTIEKKRDFAFENA
jgi:hypothetical protein